VRRRRFALAALAVAALLVVAGCASREAQRSASAGSSTAVTPPPATEAAEIARLIKAAGLPPCPRSKPEPAREGGLPELTLDCLGAGSGVTLSGLRGTPLVLNVWASWCPPCAQEMPHLNAVHRAAGDRVRFLGVDLLDRREQGLAWAMDLEMSFPSVEDPDGVIRARLRVPSPPVTVFVRPDGRVAKVHYGAFRTERQLRDMLAEHLGVRL